MDSCPYHVNFYTSAHPISLEFVRSACPSNESWICTVSNLAMDNAKSMKEWFCGTDVRRTKKWFHVTWAVKFLPKDSARRRLHHSTNQLLIEVTLLLLGTVRSHLDEVYRMPLLYCMDCRISKPESRANLFDVSRCASAQDIFIWQPGAAAESRKSQVIKVISYFLALKT